MLDPYCEGVRQGFFPDQRMGLSLEQGRKRKGMNNLQPLRIVGS